LPPPRPKQHCAAELRMADLVATHVGRYAPDEPMRKARTRYAVPGLWRQSRASPALPSTLNPGQVPTAGCPLRQAAGWRADLPGGAARGTPPCYSLFLTEIRFGVTIWSQKANARIWPR